MKSRLTPLEPQALSVGKAKFKIPETPGTLVITWWVNFLFYVSLTTLWFSQQVVPHPAKKIWSDGRRFTISRTRRLIKWIHIHVHSSTVNGWLTSKFSSTFSTQQTTDGNNCLNYSWFTKNKFETWIMFHVHEWCACMF